MDKVVLADHFNRKRKTTFLFAQTVRNHLNPCFLAWKMQLTEVYPSMPEFASWETN